ncbi:uncharacterized protein C3orf67 homolog [Melanotaenia boesemani]|uniref:uncharacterized protein C3orf67 homolog n=1 Tax=Melanotaenia boesemani TaxID=1250792 RepID=UPI001C041F57|nr:uncharacterized protein C3orf67 homolog [Melanotaenia boesemani]
MCRKMFRNNYQGGPVFELFSGQGKDPVAKWKLCGAPSAIYKEYNKEVKGFVYCLEGSSQTVKMQMPENGKMSLGLIQRFLVLQVNVPEHHNFSTELVITDSENLKRRLHLSTVHKELSSTLLHAKIPYTGLKRNTWSTLCIDLVSLTGELFKGFLTLDGITLFATCKVRRIFTMTTEPAVMLEDDVCLSGAGLKDTIPRSFHYPPDVNQVTQVFNIENLGKPEMKMGSFRTDYASDQSTTARSTSYRRTRPQGVLYTASGSRASGLSPQTGRKSSTTSERRERSACASNTMKQKTQTQEISGQGASCKLQPRPPKERSFDKQGCKKPQVLSPGRETLASSAPLDAESSGQREMTVSREKSAPSSSQTKCRQQPLTPTEKSEHLREDESSCSPAKQSSRITSTPAESPLCSSRPSLSSDPQVWNSWKSNEGSEPQLTLQEEVFTFSSQPHSPRRGQGQGDQGKTEMGDDPVQSRSGRRYHAQPEDDFIGSESDEDKDYTVFQRQESILSCPAHLRNADADWHARFEDQPDFPNMNQTSPRQHSLSSAAMQSPSTGKAEPTGMVPTRCLSPTRQDHKSQKVNWVLGGNSSFSLCRKFLQEVTLRDSKLHKEEDETCKTDDSSHNVLQLHGNLRMHEDDDEEFQMLASLKRQQEEDECRPLALSASQIHQCDVSVSMSSDDTSTWTHSSMPVNQGHHYQKEMNPLLHSDPREWMDVLSPPIMPPSQQRRSGNTQNNLESQGRGEDGRLKEEDNDDEFLTLLYDPCLNCYFDPKTGKYYELA